MKIRATMAACGLAVLVVGGGGSKAQAVAVNSGTCYQTGVTAGCAYIVTYDDGSSATIIADSQGRVTRPCNRIIVAIRVGVPGAGCYDAEPIRSGSET